MTRLDDRDLGDEMGEPEAPRYVRASSVHSELQRWLWRDRVPLGELVLIGGREKQGKSTFCVWLAARITRGDLPGDLYGRPGEVVFVSAEDHSARVLKPRLVAADADLDRVHFLNPDGPGFSIEAIAEMPEVVLVVLDPLSVFIDLANEHEYGEGAVRKSLRPFVALGQQLGFTTLGVKHVKKDLSGDNPFDAFLGSRGFPAAARSVLFVMPDPENKDRPGGLIYARGNLAAPAPAIRYRLQTTPVTLDDGHASTTVVFVIEDGEVSLTLEDAMFPKDLSPALGEAVGFLQELLADGPVLATEAKRQAVENSIAVRTLERAREKIGVVPTKEPSMRGRWVWSLPETEPGSAGTDRTAKVGPSFCEVDECGLTTDGSGRCWRHRDDEERF